MLPSLNPIFRTLQVITVFLKKLLHLFMRSNFENIYGLLPGNLHSFHVVRTLDSSQHYGAQYHDLL